MSDDRERCPSCDLLLAGEEGIGEVFCSPETSPECWTLIYSEDEA